MPSRTVFLAAVGLLAAIAAPAARRYATPPGQNQAALTPPGELLEPFDRRGARPARRHRRPQTAHCRWHLCRRPHSRSDRRGEISGRSARASSKSLTAASSRPWPMVSRPSPPRRPAARRPKPRSPLSGEIRPRADRFHQSDRPDFHQGGLQRRKLSRQAQRAKRLSVVAVGILSPRRLRLSGERGPWPPALSRGAGQQPAVEKGDQHLSPSRRRARAARLARIRIAAALDRSGNAAGGTPPRCRTSSGSRWCPTSEFSIATPGSNLPWWPISSDGSVRDVTPFCSLRNQHSRDGRGHATGLVTTRGPAGDVAVMVRYQGYVDVFRGHGAAGAQSGDDSAAAQLHRRDRVRQAQAAGHSALGGRATMRRSSAAWRWTSPGGCPRPPKPRRFWPTRSGQARPVDRQTVGFERLCRLFCHQVERRPAQPAGQRPPRPRHVRLSRLDPREPAAATSRTINSSANWSRQPATWHTIRPWSGTAPWRRANQQLEDTAQLFLGQRIQCARCHHHPYEKWSQQDYYGFAAFFAQVGRKNSLGTES